MKLNPAHRDDVDPDVLKGLEDKFPGMKILCIGDYPPETIPDEVKRVLKTLQEKHERSLALGVCIDCGKQMPNYPTPESGVSEEWEPSDGWTFFSQGEGENEQIVCWQCPKCDAKGE